MTATTYELRIISGSLRGRKLKVASDPKLRPMADRVRGALFSILGNAVPERPFFDVFAGSGAVGLEALSRGASRAVFVEKDGRNVATLQEYVRNFGVQPKVQILHADAYRWAEMGAIPAEPANVFLGPPYPEYEQNLEAVRQQVATLQERLAVGSVLILQSEKQFPAELLHADANWDIRHYGRTQLGIWVKPDASDIPSVENELA